MQNDEATNNQSVPAPEPSQSGGINAEAGRDFKVSGDLVDRDKFEIHVESGSTFIFNQSSPPPVGNQQPTTNNQPPAATFGQQPTTSNPFFTSGRLSDPHLFFGRERLVREVKAEFSKHSSVALAAESQIGKSSLL